VRRSATARFAANIRLTPGLPAATGNPGAVGMLSTLTHWDFCFVGLLVSGVVFVAIDLAAELILLAVDLAFFVVGQIAAVLSAVPADFVV
jgi:hypothetical protein